MTVISEATVRELMALHQWSAGYLERLPAHNVDQSISPTETAHMPEQRNDPVVSYAGNAGTAPINKGGNRPVEFRFAVPGGYGEEAPTFWFDVAVWNEGLQESVMREVYKGGSVAVEGYFTQDEYEGKARLHINAVRVGAIEWFQRTKRASAAPAAAPGSPAAAAPGAPATAPQTTENDW